MFSRTFDAIAFRKEVGSNLDFNHVWNLIQKHGGHTGALRQTPAGTYLAIHVYGQAGPVEWVPVVNVPAFMTEPKPAKPMPLEASVALLVTSAVAMAGLGR